MKQACLLFAIIIFLVQPAHALLRFHKKQEVLQHPVEQHSQRIVTAISFLHLAPPRLHRPRMNPDDRYNITTPGIFSFVCAMLSLVFLAGLAVTSFELLVIPVFMFAILAAVFGGIGIKRHKPGHAIIGLVLGILAMVGGFIALALL